MGLIINKTTEKSILISGTDYEINNVYARIEFAVRMDGITLEIGCIIYASKQAYLENKPIFTDIPNNAFAVTLLPNEVQDLNTALNYAKQYFDNLGYNTEIDG
jgi:hypothetical protein